MRGRPKDLSAAYAVSRRLAESNSLNNFAISSTGIGDALQRSAAALSAAGNTMEQSIGLVTAMNAVIQNPESVGTTMKTLTMFLRAAKTEAEEAGIETEGMATSVSKLRAELKELTGIDIMLDDDTFKSTYQIIEELANVWDSLTDVTQSNVLNLIGGKRNANSISALISNFKDAEAAAIAAADSMGSAYTENQNCLDSFSGKLTQIQTTFESISNNVIDSALVKTVLDIVNGLLKLAEGLSKIGLLLPTVAAGFALLKSIKLTNTVEAVARHALLLGDTVDTAKQISGIVSTFNGSQMDHLYKLLDANKLHTVSGAIFKSVDAMDDLSDATENVHDGFVKVKGVALPSFSAVAVGVTTAISLIFTLAEAVGRYNEKAIETADEIVSTFAEADEEYNRNINTIQKLSQRYYELTNKMKENGGETALTTSEYEEYQDIVKQIINTSPTLISAYGAEGEALSTYTDLIEEATTAQNEWNESRIVEQLSNSTGEKVRTGAQKSRNAALDQLASAGIDLSYNMLSNVGVREQSDIVEGLIKIYEDLGIVVDGTAESLVMSARIITEEEAYRLVENSEKFLSAVHSLGEATGIDIDTQAQNGIYGLVNAVNALDASSDQLKEWFLTYNKYASNTVTDKETGELVERFVRIKSLPTELQDEAGDIAKWVADQATLGVDGFSSLDDAINVMHSSIADLLNLTSQTPGSQSLLDYILGVENGDKSLETAKLAISTYADTLLDMGYESAVVQEVAEYFYELADAAAEARRAMNEPVLDVPVSTQETENSLQRIADLKELHEKALSDMAQYERLTHETIQAFKGAGVDFALDSKLGDVVDGEHSVYRTYLESGEKILKREAEKAIKEGQLGKFVSDTFFADWDLAGKEDEIVDPVRNAIDQIKKLADLNALALNDLFDTDKGNDLAVFEAFADAEKELKALGKEDGWLTSLLNPDGDAFTYTTESEAALMNIAQGLADVNDMADATAASLWTYWEAQKAIDKTDSSTEAFDKFIKGAELNAKALEDMRLYKSVQQDTYAEFLNAGLSGLLEVENELIVYTDKSAEALKAWADEALYSGQIAEEAIPAVSKYWDAMMSTETVDPLNAALTINKLLSSLQDAFKDGTNISDAVEEFASGMEEVGVLNWEDYLRIGDNGRYTGVIIDDLSDLQDEFINASSASEAFVRSIKDDFEAIAKGDQVNINEKSLEAYENAQKVTSFVVQAIADINSAEKKIAGDTVAELGGILSTIGDGSGELQDYLTWSEEANAWTELNEEALRGLADAMYEGVDGVEEFKAYSDADLDKAFALGDPSKAEQWVAAFSDIANGLGVVSDAWSSMQENDNVLSPGAAASVLEQFGETALDEILMPDGTTLFKANFEEIYRIMHDRLIESGAGEELVAMFDNAFDQIFASGDEAFTRLNAALNNAMHGSDLIATVKKEMEETGKLSYQTVLSMIERYGQDAMKYMTAMTKISDGEVVDKYYAANYEQLMALDRAAVEAVDDTGNLIALYDDLMAAALAGEEIKSPFENLTDGMSEAKNYMSAMEGAYDDMLESGGLTFDTLSNLMSTFGEDWTDVVNIEETTGQFEILTDKVRELAIEQLKNAGATEEMIAAYDRQWDTAINAVEESQKTAEVEAKFTIEAEGLTGVVAAIQESTSATGVGAESIRNLTERYKDLTGQGENLSNLFEATANGIHLNSHALTELEAAYEKCKMEEYSEQLSDLKMQYDELTLQIEETGDVELYTQRDAILEEMRDVAILREQYRGLTSAYNKWMEAKSGPEEGDAYDSVVESLESAKELRNAGLVGTNEFKSALQFMTGRSMEEINSWDSDTLAKEFDKVYPIMQKFFTDGASGAQKFVEEFGQLGEDGVYTFDLAAFEELGLGAEAFETILRKLKDYGWKVDIDVDPANTELELLKTTAEESQQKLSELDETTPEFDFNVNNIERAEEQIQEANDAYAKYKNEDDTWNLEIDGAEEAQTILAALIRQRQELQLDKTAVMKVDAGNVSGELGETLRIMQELQTLSNTHEVQVETGANESEIQETEAKLEELRLKLVEINDTNPDILGGLGIEDLTTVESITTAITNIPAEKLVAIGVDPTLIDGYMATEISKVGTVVWQNDTDAVDEFRARTITKTATVKWVSDDSGVGGVDGTAHVSGTAYATGTAMLEGDWGTKEDGVALGGELGPELVVRNGRFFTIGDHGAGFFRYKRNDIIFNADQTRQIFEKGKITHGKRRGRALVTGTAFADSSLNNNYTGTFAGWQVATGSSSGSKKSSSSSKKVSKKSQKSIEKLKTKYEELNATLEHLIAHQEFLFDKAEDGIDFTGMNNSLMEQANLYKEIMANAQEAISEMQKKGADDTNKELQEMEEVYWDAYNSFHDILDDINALFVDALNDKIDGVQDAYDNLSKAADEFNESGTISVDTYQSLLENGIQYLSLLDKINGQYVINQDAIDRIVAAEKEQLAIESALSYLNSIATALGEGNTNMLDKLLNNSEQIGDATWNIVYAQLDSLKNLGLTNDQYIQIVENLEALQAIADHVVMEAEDGKVEEALDDQYDAVDRILELTQDLIKYETEEQIDAINDQIDAYRKIVELKKEAINASKEQNDYEDEVLEKTQAIAELQNRIDLLSLDDSREARAEMSQLQDELKELQDDLFDIQSDRAFDVQNEALDKMADSYEEGRQEEIEALENSISSAEKLYNLAINRITNGWNTLYDELIDWNTAVGNSLNSEITEEWNLATEAVKKYGSYVAALEARNAADSSSSSQDNVKNVIVADVNALPEYHSGGTVGAAGSINADEAIAVLEQGEAVLTEKAQDSLYEIIDFQQTLSEKLGAAIGAISGFFTTTLPKLGDLGRMPVAAEATGVAAFSPSIEVNISHSGDLTTRDANKFGEQIANTAIDKLYEAFERRGLNNSLGSRFKK